MKTFEQMGSKQGNTSETDYIILTIVHFPLMNKSQPLLKPCEQLKDHNKHILQ